MVNEVEYRIGLNIMLLLLSYKENVVEGGLGGLIVVFGC